MGSDWARLPQHLLDSVVERLTPSPVDYLSFSLVCVPWLCIAKDNRKRCDKMLSGCLSPPLLLIPSREKSIWKLYNVMNNEFLSIELSVPNRRFCGSSKGWLIAVENDFTITLMNPFRRVAGIKEKKDSIIRLPPITATNHGEYSVWKATISADPIVNPNDCIVAVIYQSVGQLAIFRLTEDKEWTYMDKHYTSTFETLFVDNRVFAVNNRRQLITFDITAESCSDVKFLKRRIRLQAYVKYYLVNMNEGGLIMVERYYEFDEDDNYIRKTLEFEIFKFDVDKCKWITMDTLGDAAIFLGDNSSIHVLASQVLGCQPNCIYFTHDLDNLHADYVPPHDFGVYDVESQCISQPYTVHAVDMVKMAKQPPIWIVPSVQL